MVYNFPYLKDPSFLKEFDAMRLKQEFIKIIVLNFKEEPIQQIEGLVTGGSITLDSTSSMRRTGNISLIANSQENDLTTTRSLLSINKKVQILIGFTNNTNKYNQYPVLWFPQGVFVIMTPTITYDSNGINISLTLHDKMAFLNGECGGTLPASTTFHEVESLNEKGEKVITNPTIYQIIQELVNHFGGEQLGKIIISDLDTRVKQVMKWTGSVPLYYYSTMDDSGCKIQDFDTNYNAFPTGAETPFYEYGEDVGFIYTDFTFPGELIGNAGDTVVTILDKIRDTLGNYEYFYDVQGNFRFQQIKNYLNTTYAVSITNLPDADSYLVDYSNGKSVYTFDDANIITSYSNAPQYGQIKNDFLVWGKRTTVEGQDRPIRYHLAIDTKPQIGNTHQVFFYTDEDDKILKAKKPLDYTNQDLPSKGQPGVFYLKDGLIYYWEDGWTPTPYLMTSITSTDYRSELYLQGVDNEPMGLDSGYYFPELKNEWTKLYDLVKQDFYEKVKKMPSQIDYFLDFIDTPTAIAEFGVQNIGRRTTVISEDSINCIFESDIPDVVIIQTGTDETNEKRNECIARGQEYSQVKSQIYSQLAVGGVLRSAYEEIRKELYQYTSYNEQVTLSILPIYYLEPNTRITIRDVKTGIYGDYIIKSISLPLDTNSTMSLTCTKALERI